MSTSQKVVLGLAALLLLLNFAFPYTYYYRAGETRPALDAEGRPKLDAAGRPVFTVRLTPVKRFMPFWQAYPGYVKAILRGDRFPTPEIQWHVVLNLAIGIGAVCSLLVFYLGRVKKKPHENREVRSAKDQMFAAVFMSVVCGLFVLNLGLVPSPLSPMRSGPRGQPGFVIPGAVVGAVLCAAFSAIAIYLAARNLKAVKRKHPENEEQERPAPAKNAMRKCLKIVAVVFCVAVLVLAWPIWKRYQVRKAFDLAKRQNIEQVEALLESKPQLAKASIGWTLLHWASGNAKVDLANLLLEKGADVNAKDFHGNTPLEWAAGATTESSVGLFGLGLVPLTGSFTTTSAEFPSRLQVVRILIDHGADVNARSDERSTALARAAIHGLTDVAELLLANGADVNASDILGCTSLHWAASRGEEELVELLLLNGADVSAKDKDGNTPLQYASRRGHKGIVQLLRTAAAPDNPATTAEARATKAE